MESSTDRNAPEVRSIFLSAMERQTPSERAAYLDRACGDNRQLRVRIEALLAAHDRAGGFLQPPCYSTEGGLGITIPTEGPGAVIGRYKLLEKIGEGGMAIVYMAEQEQPIRRKVALKIIKLGMDTKQVIARFEAERQALAMMDHPSIAKVLDAGATETGRPYFVMELVTGVSITEYCDQNRFGTKDRVDLFVQVCNAVQHAHQKGIIHRDIKPSNVMVAHHDGKPVPKVIDFGIAKATNQRLTEKTLFTRYAHIIGTPAYMSPEQAELNDLDVDTRSDIYSLGVLLYELLTGTTPFGEEELRKAGYIEMQRVIREEEPAKPSTKLSTLGETLTDIARHRNANPDALTKAIQGDLDWIVMKTLEKARDRRYDNASALALDVRRHLDDQPVLARAPSTIYRLRKFLRRHRSRVAIALIIVIPLSAMMVALAMWNQNRLQLAVAESVRHSEILALARESFDEGDYPVALRNFKSILNSEHVGPDARLMYNAILAHARQQIIHYTAKIEADPEDAKSYFRRARYFDYLDERDKANADMGRYSAILGRGWTFDLQFGPPENLGPAINSATDDWYSAPSADGLLLYFARSGHDVKYWVAGRPTKDDPWGNAVTRVFPPSAPVSTKSVPNATTGDGLELYYSLDLRGGHGSIDLWVVTREGIDAPWSAPINLEPPVNSEYEETWPAISPDGLELYFSGFSGPRARPGGHGHSDLWVTRRPTRNNAWGAPENLGSTVNSAAQDARPSLSLDGLTLFFDSRRPGGYGLGDLYVSRRASRSDPWGEPVNLGPTVNSPALEFHPLPSADGSTLFFTSERPGGYGGYDIWQVRIIEWNSQLEPNDKMTSTKEQTVSGNRKEVVPEESH